MAEAMAPELDESKVPDTKAAEHVTDEMKAEAKASLERRNASLKEEPATGTDVVRRKGGGRNRAKLETSDIDYPVEVHGEDFEDYGPQGFASSIPEGVEITEYSVDQEFIINGEQVKKLTFDSVKGRNLPKHRLYTVKAIHKDGRIVQLPFEAQVQNNAGGDPEDAIGLRRYQRKGIYLLIDWNTLRPIYCAAWDCWAEAEATGFCSMRHAQHTLPNMYKDAGEITQGLMSAGVTTRRTWSS